MNEQILDVATVPQNTADSFLALVERAARDPSVDIGKMERLLEMAEKVHARQAESQYNEAMNAAQGEMRPVARDCNNPQTHSRYASYGALDNALRPVYSAHGFSLSFGTKAAGPDSVTITCRVSHRAGHTEKVEIEMPADGKGAKGGDVMTKTHATGSAVSYGMRYLLKMIFNVSVGEYDDDGNAASQQRSKTPQDAPRASKVPAAKKEAPTPQRATQSAEKATHEPAKDAKFDPAVFLANCKTRLLSLVLPDDEWAWWKYAQDKSWILPNESLANATADKMFEGYDPKDIQKSVRDLFDAHCTAVNAMAANCPPEFREEILRGFVQMPRLTGNNDWPEPIAKPIAAPSPPRRRPVAAPSPGNSCPSCSSTCDQDTCRPCWCSLVPEMRNAMDGE